MHWGHKITLAFILFAAFIFYMVFRAFQENVDLVADDYYAREIRHESKMKRIANFNELDKKVTLEQEGEQIIISFNGIQEPTGQIHFYHPSREAFDRTYEISLDEDGQQTVSRKELVAGRYRVNITWTSGGKEYYQQARIFIQ